MTYAQMQARVQQTIQDTTGSVLANIQFWLNDGQQDFVSRKDWPWLLSSDTFTTTANDDTYSLASTAHRVINLRDETNDQFILEMNRNVHQLAEPYVNTSSDVNAPTQWYPFGVDSDGNLQVKLYPVPAGAYTVRYDFWKRATDMSADSDKGVVPERYHAALVHFAAAKYFEFQQDEMASYHAAQYENGVLKALQDSDETDNMAAMLPAKSIQYRGNSLADEYFLRL